MELLVKCREHRTTTVSSEAGHPEIVLDLSWLSSSFGFGRFFAGRVLRYLQNNFSHYLVEREAVLHDHNLDTKQTPRAKTCKAGTVCATIQSHHPVSGSSRAGKMVIVAVILLDSVILQQRGVIVSAFGRRPRCLIVFCFLFCVVLVLPFHFVYMRFLSFL